MGFISSSGNIIQAVLTKKGREMLAKGQFNITKYGFSDDGVNYNLYDSSLGTDADAAILSLPITEPSTNDASLRNLLVTMDSGTQILTWLAVNPTSGLLSGTYQVVSFYAKTMNKVGSPEQYDVVDINNQTAWDNNINVSQSFVNSQTNVEFSYKANVNITEALTFTFKLRGRETGIVSDQLTISAAAFVGIGMASTPLR